MLYAETEVLRAGNDAVLDSLQEGVVILEEGAKDNDGILYSNAAAQGKKEFSIMSKQFCVIDKEVFNGPILDTNKTIQNLEAVEDYLSITQIIAEELAEESVIFKMKE